MLVPPLLLARLACNCARRAWISARERVAVGGGANMAATDVLKPEVCRCSPMQGMNLTDRPFRRYQTAQSLLRNV